MSRFIVLAAGLALLLSQTVRAQCELNANCASCIGAATYGCGWCASSQQCHLGTTGGPQNSSAVCSAWFWQRCPSCTGLNYNCAVCVENSGCGFCGTGSSGSFCLEGNSTAPYRNMYACATWTYGAQATCPSPAPPSPPSALTCSQFSGGGDCYSCVDQTGCGWCAATQECLPVGSGGPLNGSCSAWYLSCPACSNYGSCTLCLNNYNCGWCASAPGNQQCFNGNATGPYRGPCDAWAFGRQRCPVTSSPFAPNTPAPSYCSGYTSCSYCLEEGGCGWCSATQLCLLGGASGPSSGSCPLWVPPGAQCPSCSSRTYNCEYCRIESQCGWCGTVNSGNCYDGNATGPFTATCPPGEWIHFPTTCSTGAPPTPVPSATCAAYQTCASCNGFNGCGWCENTQQCIPGSVYGPSIGSCPTWRFGTYACPSCSQYYNCATCTSSADDLCGWCTSSETCVAGNSSGPFNSGAFCSNWTAPGGSCFYDPCSQYKHCPDCLDTPQQTCGWCMTSGTCRSGSVNGPNSGTCPSWWYEVCPSGYCNQNKDCATCVASPAGDCGWCTSTKVCASGTSTGPNSGTCSGAWEWYSAQCLDATAEDTAPERARPKSHIHKANAHRGLPAKIPSPRRGAN